MSADELEKIRIDNSAGAIFHSVAPRMNGIVIKNGDRREKKGWKCVMLLKGREKVTRISFLPYSSALPGINVYIDVMNTVSPVDGVMKLTVGLDF